MGFAITGDYRPMTHSPTAILSAAIELPETSGGADVPEWVHILPKGRVDTFDRRGPFQADDLEGIVQRSMSVRGDLEIDVNHATFRVAPKGGDAPARGWIKEMQVREDGIWARTEWTPEGRALIATRAYRRLSPVLIPVAKGSRVIDRILNVSLVNRQNLRGLAALNSEEEDMNFLAKLAEALGLDMGDDVTEATILEAIKALKGGGANPEMQSQLAEIGTALGCDEGAKVDAVLNAARELADGAKGGDEVIASLQSELTSVAQELGELKDQSKRVAAEAFVDAAIAGKRVGVASQRDRLITMHMENPENTEALIGGFPKLANTHTLETPPSDANGAPQLNAEQAGVAAALGFSTEGFAEALKADQA